MSRRLPRGRNPTAIAAACVLAAAAAGAKPVTAPSDPHDDPRARRAEAWTSVLSLLGAGDDEAFLGGWTPSEVALGATAAMRPSAAHGAMTQSGEAEVIIRTHYNPVAFRHLQEHGLHRRANLDALRRAGEPDPNFPQDRTIPAFPAGSAVILTVWWPVASHGLTPMPVWDPEANPALSGGNGYATWRRAIAVDPRPHAGTGAAAIDFLGTAFAEARVLPLERFRHVSMDGRAAAELMRQPGARKASVIALGRPLRAGDHLALVAAHVVVKRERTWLWATLWWHDTPSQGDYAASRPSGAAAPWDNYLLDVADDMPARAAPRATFNPWLEARFPDQGGGGGLSSNCVACHARASYPAVGFLPVRSRVGDPADPAFRPGRLRTDFLWAIARRP